MSDENKPRECTCGALRTMGWCEVHQHYPYEQACRERDIQAGNARAFETSMRQFCAERDELRAEVERQKQIISEGLKANQELRTEAKGWLSNKTIFLEDLLTEAECALEDILKSEVLKEAPLYSYSEAILKANEFLAKLKATREGVK